MSNHAPSGTPMEYLWRHLLGRRLDATEEATRRARIRRMRRRAGARSRGATPQWNLWQ